MSDQDFVIVDEEKDSEIPQEKENRTEDSRKEVVKDAEKEREDDDGYEKICFICHRPESVTGKMIDLPNHITVCPDCMQRSFDAMSSSPLDLGKMMNMPGVQFLNLSDLEGMQPEAKKIKKKKEKPKEFPELDIKNIPAPHKIKARLDEYVVGQERAKKRKSRNIWKKNKSSIVLQQSRRSQNTTAILPEKIKKAASCSFPRKSRWKNASAVLRQISTDSSRRTTTESRKKNVCRSVLSTKKAITRDAERSGSMTFRICSRN